MFWDKKSLEESIEALKREKLCLCYDAYKKVEED